MFTEEWRCAFPVAVKVCDTRAGHQARTAAKLTDRRERRSLGHGGSPVMWGSGEEEEVDAVEVEWTCVEVVAWLRRWSARRKRPTTGRRSGRGNGGTRGRRGGSAGRGEGVAARRGRRGGRGLRDEAVVAGRGAPGWRLRGDAVTGCCSAGGSEGEAKERVRRR